MKREKNHIGHFTDPSPESEVTVNYQGKDATKLKHAWSAVWITHPTESTLDYGVFLFRRIFHLTEKPHKFIVFVSADNRYRLFVNGKSVCFGPALGDLEHYRYETIDLAPFLVKGKNVVAAEVVNFGEFRRCAQQSFQTAFILQGEKSNPVNIDTGQSGWKVIKNSAYHPIPFSTKDLKAYYCAGPGDDVDATAYPWGWQELNFDDHNWLEPRPANVEFAVGRGFIYGSTWFLVPRKIPFLEEKKQRFKRIVRYKGASVSAEFVKGKGGIKVPPFSKASILFDHGVHTVGFPELIVSGGKKSEIKITYAEALFLPIEKDITDGHISLIDRKGNRNETQGKEIFGVYDLFHPDGGSNRLFRPLWKRTFRYVQLDVVTQNESLTIDDFSSVFMGYPFKEQAKFESDDPQLRLIWQTAWRTLRNGADEIFQDTPYYEQLQYIGDTRLSALVSIYVSGDDRLMRKAIEQFDDSRISEGLTQSRYPTFIKQIIPPFSLIWIAMLHDYFWYRNDPQFLQRFLSGVRSVLEWFADRLDKNGLLHNLDWWNFTDWVEAFPNGIPPGADSGHSCNITLQFLYGLKHGLELFEYFGWQKEFHKFKKISQKIKYSVYEQCFDNKKGLFAETPEKKIFSQHTNILAILTDALAKNRQKKLMLKILTNKGLIQTTLYFKFYLFRALQKTGLADEYLNQLQPWQAMLRNGLTTFAETDSHPRSDCHPWSATPCFDFLHTVAGILPETPGFKRVTIAPNFGYLTHIKAEMPIPQGIVKIDLNKKSATSISGFVALPENTSGSFHFNNKQIPLKPGAQKIIIK